uniref:Uncharacterized protein n=1 Tax=Panagrolaimus sp. ES5 TaxID=591445 RepID=A0AC34G9E5_9BILA
MMIYRALVNRLAVVNRAGTSGLSHIHKSVERTRRKEFWTLRKSLGLYFITLFTSIMIPLYMLYAKKSERRIAARR